MINSIEALKAYMGELYLGLEETKSDWALRKKAVTSGVLTPIAIPPLRVEVSRPMGYEGK